MFIGLAVGGVIVRCVIVDYDVTVGPEAEIRRSEGAQDKGNPSRASRRVIYRGADLPEGERITRLAEALRLLWAVPLAGEDDLEGQ